MNAQQFVAEFGHIAHAPGGLANLRRMIYQLAVTGSLTPRGESAEDAALLLARIGEERQRLIRAKNYKRMLELESEPVRSPPDIVLPTTWRWTRLLDIGEINPRNDAPDEQLAAFVPMSGVPQLHRAGIVAETKRWGDIKKGYTHFANGDVVLAKITPCFENGKAAVVEGLPGDAGIGAGTTELQVLRPIHAGVVPAYVYLFLRSPLFTVEGERNMTGTAGQKRVPTDYFATRAFPLPPSEEQSRIVAKVDELMALCDQLEQQQQDRRKLQNALRQATLQALAGAESARELETSWQRLQVNLGSLFSDPGDVDALRGLVLDLGLRGYLTQRSGSGETADNLLSQLEERKRELAQHRKLRLQRLLPPLREDELPNGNPKGWNWIRLGAIAELINGDRGKNYPNKDEYVSEGVPWINTGHIEPNGTLSVNHMNFISREKFEVLNSGKIEPGDLVYCLRGATFGKTAFVSPYVEGAIASSLMIIRPLDARLAKYVYYYLISPLGRSQIFRFDNGTAQPNLSANSVGLFSFPLPPVDEQERIVRQIEELMLVCDRLENQLRSTRRVAELLAVTIVGTLTGIAIEQEEEIVVKAPQTELIAPLRLATPPDVKARAPLATILARHQGEMAARDLWQRFGGEIDAFYAQLKNEVMHGWIDDPTYVLDPHAPDGPKKYPDGSQVAKMKIKQAD